MSVSPSLATIQESLLPRRFRQLGFPQARGSNNARVWTMGEGPFIEDAIAPELKLLFDPEDPERHGFIEPDRAMPLHEYTRALHATQDQWRVDEEL